MRRTRRTLALPLWLSLAAAGAFAGPLACAPTPGETLGTSASFIVSGVATSVVRVAVTATSVPAGRSYTTDLVRVGDNWQGTLSGMLVGAYSFAGTAYDATGNVLFRGSLSSPVTIANNGTSMVALNLTQASQIAAFRNNAPVIDALVGSSNAIVPSDTISLAATAHDPDADPLTYAWSSSAGTFSAANALSTNWTAPATEGTYTLTLVVSDNRGASTSARYQVRVAAANGRGSAALTVSLNNAPVISGFTVGGNDATGTSNLAVMATDPDGDTLTYSWSSSCAGYFAGSATNNRALNNSPSPSTTFTQTPATVACTLTVVVRDGMGNSNTATVIRGAGPTTNTNPVVAPSFQSVNGVGNAGTVILRAEGSDPDGTAVTLAWTTSLGTLSAPRAYTGSAGTSVAQEVTWTAPDCFPMGMATVTVTATDPGGLTAARTFTIASTNAFNLQTDATNCGACGNVCPSPGANGVAACVAGACQLSCVSGYHLVGSACVVDTDTMSCGPTGTLCATPNNAAPTCDGTTCGFSCNASFGDCDSNASNGCESSLPTDPNNCGACGHVCSDHGYSTPVCNAGNCDFVCRAGYGNCDGDPGNGCETDVNVNPSHCGSCAVACSPPLGSASSGPGTVSCIAGGCQPQCPSGATPVWYGSGYQCINLLTDPSHCGTYSNSCAFNQRCSGGSCVDRPIACGDFLTFEHVRDGGFLHSHSINYPGGSMQQQVTRFLGSDPNNVWRLECSGGTYRFNHVGTGRYLHSHAGIPSPTSGQQEVTGYGSCGDSDLNNYWHLEGPGGNWMPNVQYRVIHNNTGVALHSHPLPSSPDLANQFEVTGYSSGGEAGDYWVLHIVPAASGVCY